MEIKKDCHTKSRSRLVLRLYLKVGNRIKRFAPGAYTILMLPLNNGVNSLEVVTSRFHFVGIRLLGETLKLSFEKSLTELSNPFSL